MPTNTAQELFNVKGLVAVITGGGSGLGLYAARALDANGAKAVYIVGRREETLKAAAATAVNGNIIPVVGDVTDKNSLIATADRVRKEQGFINLLFANAGIAGPYLSPDSRKSSDIKDLQAAMFAPSMEDFTQTMHVNVTSVYFTAVAFLDLLAAGNAKGNQFTDSQILVTSSVAGHSRHLSAGVAYSISKAAVSHLTYVLATFFGQDGRRIRANIVAPGFYPSELTASILPGGPSEGGAFVGSHALDLKTAPAERTGSEEDFAGVILYAASRAGAYLNGATLLTDGGRLSVLPAFAPK